MSVPRTGKDVLELVRKSGVADDATLNAFLQKSEPLLSNPGEAAAQFLLAGILTELQAEFILKGDPTGFRLGKYVLLERLGDWYHASHRLMQRRVTIQMLPASVGQERDERLERSQRWCYREVPDRLIDHPNVVRAYDIDQHEAQHFVVFEYLEGKRLPVVLEQAGGRLPIGEACGCAIQAARGLQYAHEHENKVCHYGINPTNLFVCENGVVKILNLWFNRYDLPSDEIDVNYTSPEQHLDSDWVGYQTDIYSLGAVLYHLVTGQAPFANEADLGKKLIAHFRDVPFAHTLCTAVPEPLSFIIAMMMAKRVEQRYHSMAEVIEALRPFVEPAATGDYPEMAAAALGM